MRTQPQKAAKSAEIWAHPVLTQNPLDHIGHIVDLHHRLRGQFTLQNNGHFKLINSVTLSQLMSRGSHAK